MKLTIEEYVTTVILATIIYILLRVRKWARAKRKKKEAESKIESPIEEQLFEALWVRGHQPTTQEQVGRYRIDIAFKKEKIAIECDGKAYHSTKQQLANDRRKDRYLRNEGWRVLRFSGSQIYNDPDLCCRQIEECLKW